MSGNQKCKGHNSNENYSTETKFKRGLCIPKTHLHSEFQLKKSMYDGDNEQKLKIYWNFFKSKRNNSAENYSTGTKSELDLYILIIHLYTKF